MRAARVARSCRMPRHVNDDVASNPRGAPMSTASTVPITEICTVSTRGVIRNARKVASSFGGQAPRRNRATLARVPGSNNSRGSTCASRRQKANVTAQAAARRYAKALLPGEPGEGAAGAAKERGSSTQRRDLALFVGVPRVQVLQQLGRDPVARQVEVHASVSDAHDAGEIVERELHAVQVHQQRLARLAGEI